MTFFGQKFSLVVLSLFGAGLLAACSGPALLNSLVPRDGYTVHGDIAYGDQARQRLDIYVPDNLSADAPVIVFFYGGSWQSGSKSDYRFVGQAFASKGYVAVIADYRLYPDIQFPTFLDDSARAVAWVDENIHRYSGDRNHLFVAGHSAGAYIAVMIGLRSPYTKSAHDTDIKGIVGIAGPYNFLPFTDPKIKDIFRPEDDVKTQPIHWVKPGLPPLLLVTGDKDKDVLPQNTITMTQALRDHKVSVTSAIYQGVAHVGIILSLAKGFRSKTTLLDDIDLFIQKTMEKEKP